MTQNKKKHLSECDNKALTAVHRNLAASLELGESQTFLPIVPANQPDLYLLDNLDSLGDRETFISSLGVDKTPTKETGQWSDCEEIDVYKKVTDLYKKMVGQID